MSRRFDVVAVADTRFPGGTSTALCREIDACAAAGIGVALLPVRSPVFRGSETPHPGLTDRIESGTVQVLTADEPVDCRLLVAHNPVLFEDPLPERRRVTAEARLLVVHQAPVGGDGRLIYDPARVGRTLVAAFGSDWLWAPTGPAGRRNLVEAGIALRVTRADWPLIVEAERWGRPRAGCRGPVPVAGRHSRPDRLKWPTDAGDLLRAFPPADDLRVRLMGFEGAIAGEVGPVPENWEVLPFGAEPPERFLESLDFFVYHPHRRIFETYGLTVAEALASGAVAILAPGLRETFAEAALYAEPAETPALIRRLCADSAAYARQSQAGWQWVREHLGPERYLAAIRGFLAEAGSASGIPGTVVQATAEGDRLRRRRTLWRWLRRGAAVARRLPGGAAAVRRLRGGA